MHLAYTISISQNQYACLITYLYFFSQLKRLPHFFVKLRLCGINSKHLASLINSIRHSASSSVRSYNKQSVFHTISHKYNGRRLKGLRSVEKATRRLKVVMFGQSVIIV